MPRGGRRRGAGAPKGNFNGLKGGKYSPRLTMVYLAFLGYEDKLELAHALYDAGFYRYRSPHYEFNGDLRGLVRFLYKKFFDSPEPAQSNVIEPSQTPPFAEDHVDSTAAESRTA